MSLKRECDRCGVQEHSNVDSMVRVELPEVKAAYPDWSPLRRKRVMDMCLTCARRIHDAADKPKDA